MSVKSILKHILPLPAANANDAERRILSEITGLKERLDNLAAENALLKKQLDDIRKNTSEAIWADVFHDATRESPWLKEKSFWPGRSALGYQAMYVVYRILNETKPKRILELGLGQSSKLISQYAEADMSKDVVHVVVENNKDWIDFFSKTQVLSKNTELTLLDWKMTPYKDGETRVFDGFKERFEGEKFDFILVDAPLGADLKQYSRVDVLEIIPLALEKDFSILIDDTDREGEQNTVNEVIRLLDQSGVPHCEHCYEGLKSSTVICSSRLSFLATL